VLRRGRIQILAGKRTAIARLSIILLETEHPLTTGSFGSALPNCFLNFSDGAQIAIDLSQVHQTRFNWVSVRVDKTGNNSSPFEVYLLGFARGQRLHFCVRADGEKVAVCDRDCFSARSAIVDGDDVTVVKNQLRLDAVKG
jgi:hypothetical protein